jgi:hypothetical protein
MGLLVALLAAISACGEDPASTDTAGASGEQDGVDPEAIVGDASPDADAADSKPRIKADVDTSDAGCATDDDCKDIGVEQCQRAACNTDTGKCEVKAANKGTNCDDGQECTEDACDDAGKCVGTVKCDDFLEDGKTANICTTDKCDDAGKCVHENNKLPCDDGNACTLNDACGAGGKCAGGKSLDVAKDCQDDGNPCTDNACDPKTGCTHKTRSDGEDCDDGNKCTANNVCKGGNCDAGIAVTCEKSTNPCSTYVCEPNEGCVAKAASQGAACDNGDACDVDDVCIDKQCKGKPLPGIDDGNPCTDKVCKTVNGKPVIDKAPSKLGAKCDDKVGCTKQDQCDGKGKCAGLNLVCNDGNPCTDDACDEKKCLKPTDCGYCASTPKKDGDPCDDGSKCTTKDACAVDTVKAMAECKGLDYTKTGQCDDKNVCTNDSCQPAAGCINVPVPDKFCDDGDPCTNIDKCLGAKCQGVKKDCNDGNDCTTDACDPKTSQCTHTVDPGIKPCSDNDKCTEKDVCQAGKCVGSKVVCDDGNPCTTDQCSTVFGCVKGSVPGGTPCNDGLSCTTGDQCSGGKCVPGKDECVSCKSDLECKAQDDNNFCNGIVKCVVPAGKTSGVCAVDEKTVVKCDNSKDTDCSKNTCNPETGACTVAQKPAGAACGVGDKCITKAFCDDQGQCNGQKLDCDDAQPCTIDSCVKTAGCLHKNLPDNDQCEDGNKCTPGDKCQGGKCISGVNACKCKSDADCEAYKLDDGDLCNGMFGCVSDVCQEIKNSVVKCPELKGEPCKDNACVPSTGKCEPKARPDAAQCDDGDVCTLKDSCSGGKCLAAGKAQCDDNNPCTDDVCDFVFGCENAKKAPGAICNDGSACTEKDTCTNGECKGTALKCDDGNDCTLDICDKQKGCKSQAIEGLKCDDGDPCSQPDECTGAGVCKGKPLNCDDNDPCTIDACDGKGGCKNVSIEGKDCSDGDQCTVGDKCLQGKCLGKKKDCDDANACTEESCQLGACVVVASVTKPCDDANACTENDACSPTGTCAGTTIECKADGVCGVALQCSPVKGCVIAANDGVSCNDNNLCTIQDKCAGGGCQGIALNCDDNNLCTDDSCEPKKGCQIKQNLCDDKNDCTFDTCDKVKGCLHEAVDGKACDDGNPCTEKGQCQQDKCVSSPLKCDDKNSCTIDSCNVKAEAGKDPCVYLPGDDTQVSCDDKNPCTDDVCASGKCESTKKVCDDKNPCTLDSCNELKGCVVSDVKDGDACDDGDICTEKTVCQGGFCSGGNQTCELCPTGEQKECDIFDPGNNKCDGWKKCIKKNPLDKGGICVPQPEPVECDTTQNLACIKNQCNPASGKCEMTESVNGSACQDGQGCTTADYCLNGKCLGGKPTDCSTSGNQCNDGKCQEDPAAKDGYKCIGMPKAGTPTCDADGSGCTSGDYCSEGICKKGAPVSCAGVAGKCQVATCKSLGDDKFDCAIGPADDGTPCTDDQLCTVGDACKAGKCVAGTKPYDCSEITGACAIGFCDKTGNAGSGACVPQPQNEGAKCDADKNGCSVGDKCVGGTCVPGAPPDCDAQSSACTIGACKSINELQFQCIGAPKKDQLPCEADQNGCTVGDACKTGVCSAGPKADCSAKTSKDGCMVGTCKSLANAQYTCEPLPAPKGTACDADNNGCTKGDACTGEGGCGPGVAIDCLAFTGSCAQGTCKSTGPATFQCEGQAKPDGVACDADASGCTQKDTCKAGKCIPGPLVDCSASIKDNQCQVQKCIPAGSDNFQCDAASKKDGEVCNKDDNGCTTDDKCDLGFCIAGDMQMCSQFASLCADGKCKSTGTNSFKCDVLPKESNLPLDPSQPCFVDDVPSKCSKGYECVQTGVDIDKKKVGICYPKVIVGCDDKNPCTEGDACQEGKCLAGKAKDCDDDDPCTLDSCNVNSGKCVSTPIPGCVACVNDKFEDTIMEGWVDLSKDPTYATWKVASQNPYKGSKSNLRLAWAGPSKTPDAVPLIVPLRHARLYAQAALPVMVDFYLSMTTKTDGCGADDLQVLVNGTKVWQRCADTTASNTEPGSNFEHVKIPLAGYNGVPVTIELRAIAGQAAIDGGTIDIDNFRVTGACGPACMGVTNEPNSLTQALFPPEPVTGDVIPEDVVTMPDMHQPWVSTSSAGADAYVYWKSTKLKAPDTGHSGENVVQATYSGAPPGGKVATTTFHVPMVKAEKGGKFYFHVRAPVVGDGNCGADDLVVTITPYDKDGKKQASKEVYKLCGPLGNWQEQAIDLPEAVTVDVEFQIITGTGSSSKGTFQLDDFAVVGACQFACFYDNFDIGTLDQNWNIAGNGGATMPKWKAANISSYSPPNSAYHTHDQTAGVDKTTTMTHKTGVSVNTTGATWTYRINMFVQGYTCGTPNPQTPPSQIPLSVVYFRAITQAVNPPINLVSKFKKTAYEQPDSDGNKTLNEHCESTGLGGNPAWQLVSGKVPKEVGDSPWRPHFLAGHTDAKLAKLVVHVEDLTVMCSQ